MLTFIVVCILLYLGYRILRWAFTGSKGRSSGRRSGGDGFFDGFGDGDGGD